MDEDKPIVVGLYGLSASGKSYLVEELKKIPGAHRFYFREGAEIISRIVPGGIDAFKTMEPLKQASWRQQAISMIQADAVENDALTIVAGHFSFWKSGNHAIERVWTKGDERVYTHIMYLKTAPDVIVEQNKNDRLRNREQLTIEETSRWQEKDLAGLQEACDTNGIPLTIIEPSLQTPAGIVEILNTLDVCTEGRNMRIAFQEVDKSISNSSEIVLVFDADKTLAPVDIGRSLCARLDEVYSGVDALARLHSIFAGGTYNYEAFRKAVMLFENLALLPMYKQSCQEIVNSIKLYPKMQAVLADSSKLKHITIIVVTSGLRDLWQDVVDGLDLPHPIKVIGGSRPADRYVVTQRLKGEIVKRLQKKHSQKVYAFGDSPVDIDMLEAADKAFVIVPPASIRSKSMTGTLQRAVSVRSLEACQICMVAESEPYPENVGLPISTLPQILSDLQASYTPRLYLQTDTAASKLLATLTRNQNISGLDLCKSHKAVGQYLALHVLSQIIGLEEYDIPHVQGSNTKGYRIKYLEQTTIVALMRGGEPMATGVRKQFPLAQFVHARDAEDLEEHHIEKQKFIILVDSVINSGKSIKEFVERVRQFSLDPQIIVVAGVVQDGCLEVNGLLNEAVLTRQNVILVALRSSANKYTGSGGTDTGNRLFNTQHLD